MFTLKTYCTGGTESENQEGCPFISLVDVCTSTRDFFLLELTKLPFSSTCEYSMGCEWREEKASEFSKSIEEKNNARASPQSVDNLGCG